MGKISELTITKGRTVKAPIGEEWVRVEYSVKVAVEDDSEMQVAKAHVEGLIDGWLSNALGAQLSAGVKTEQPRKAEDFKPGDLFPEDLRQLLSFEEQAEYVIVKPKQFLGAENFAKIAEIVRAHGGDYVSKGKGSHFRIPVKS